MKASDALMERLIVLEQRTVAAHSRVDKLESSISKQLETISNDLKELTAHMNKGKGWAAAAICLSALAGGTISKLIFK